MNYSFCYTINMLLGNEKLNNEIVKKELFPIFSKYRIKDAILFGSVAKGNNSVDSDVDLVLNTDLKGLSFLGMIEEIRNVLNKKIDAINYASIDINSEFYNEIKKTGCLIYG